MPYTKNVPFCVILSGTSYRGTVTSTDLADKSNFKVEILNGSCFTIKASFDKELKGYSWTADNPKWHTLALVIGKIIERRFARQEMQTST
jgi:hypothetical protein